MRKGNLRAAGAAFALVLAALGLLGCGSSSSDTTTTGPALDAATAGHLAKLSDRIATDLDAGETCTAAHAADDLAAAVQDAQLPDSLRSGVDAAAGRLVDQVNCPPPPPPPPKEKKEEKKPKHEEHGKHGEHPGGEQHAPPGHSQDGGIVPPGQAKLKGEPG
jgi:hypothetical protein